jgi:hypothetical protein
MATEPAWLKGNRLMERKRKCALASLFNRFAEAAKITIKMYALSSELVFPHSGLKYGPSRHAIKSLGLGRRIIYLLCRTLDVSRALVGCAVCCGNAHSVPCVAKTIR